MRFNPAFDLSMNDWIEEALGLNYLDSISDLSDLLEDDEKKESAVECQADCREGPALSTRPQ